MVHRFHLDDIYIAVDVCSGSVHVLDETAYEIIGGYEEKDRQTLTAETAEKLHIDQAEAEECYDQVTE